jgi:hypothetical protein
MIGAALRAGLSQHQARVIQLVRRTPVSNQEVQWNPASTSPIFSPQSFQGFDAAIHLSGANVAAHRWTPAYRREMAVSRVNSTRALATALASLDSPPRVLLVASAVGIYGDRGDEILDESSLPGRGFLADLCALWETVARPASAAGIRVVHMRFGVVLSPGAGALARMLPLFRLGLGGKLGSGRQWMSWISVDDLVAAALFAIASPTLEGAVNFVSPHPVTNAEFTRTLAGLLHRPAIFPAPSFALRLAFGKMADEALLASARVLPRKLLGAAFQFSQPTLPEALTVTLK